MVERTTLPMAHEPDRPRLIVLMIGAGAVLVTVAAVVGVALLVAGRPAGPPARAASGVAAEARLQPAPAQDIATYRVAKDRLLHEYAWVDRPHGVVRIPIERAMALLVQQRAKGSR
jgi:hypothetical protein